MADVIPSVAGSVYSDAGGDAIELLGLPCRGKQRGGVVVARQVVDGKSGRTVVRLLNLLRKEI